MLRTALKGLLAHKLRLVATALAVDAGCRLHGRHARADRHDPHDLRQPLRRRLPGHRRRGPGQGGLRGGRQGTGEQRGRVDASLVATVRAGVDGVAAAEGGVFGYARLIGKDGKALGNPATGAPTLGAAGPTTRRSTRSRWSPGSRPERRRRGRHRPEERP